MNAGKYEEIMEACALRADLDILPAKDMTEIGEKVRIWPLCNKLWIWVFAEIPN